MSGELLRQRTSLSDTRHSSLATRHSFKGKGEKVGGPRPLM